MTIQQMIDVDRTWSATYLELAADRALAGLTRAQVVEVLIGRVERDVHYLAYRKACHRHTRYDDQATTDLRAWRLRRAGSRSFQRPRQRWARRPPRQRLVRRRSERLQRIALGDSGERCGKRTTGPQEGAIVRHVFDEQVVPTLQVTVHEQDLDLTGRQLSVVGLDDRAVERQLLLAAGPLPRLAGRLAS